jgi:hypothetical protein
MQTRTTNFYDIMAQGLAGFKNYQEFIDDTVAKKYNVPQTEGFAWDDKIQNGFTYEALEAEMGVYAMATFVDLNSEGGTHATSGAKLSTGDIPRFKHGFKIDEKELREQIQLAEQFGTVTNEMQDTLQMLLFNSSDKLIGGNYNTLTYQRHQAVSTGAFALTATNNPGGITGITFDFGVPALNKKSAGGFGSIGTKYAWSSASANPIGDLQDMVQYADDNNIPYGSFEMSKKLWNTFRAHVNVKSQVAIGINMAADLTNVGSMTFMDSAIKAYLEGIGLPPITIIDALVQVDKFNPDTRKVDYTTIRPFDEAKVVLRPAGALGTIKAVRPLVFPDPAARIAFMDGGRTVLKQTFDSKNVIQYIESELTALCVPTTSRYILQLKTDEAAA